MPESAVRFSRGDYPSAFFRRAGEARELRHLCANAAHTRATSLRHLSPHTPKGAGARRANARHRGMEYGARMFRGLADYQRYRDYRRYRAGPSRLVAARGTRSPGISRCTEKFTRETRFPRLPALPRGHEQ